MKKPDPATCRLAGTTPLARVDAALASLAARPRPAPSVAACLRAVRAAGNDRVQTALPPTTDDILTLGTVAELLGLTSAQMDDVAGELPAFELAGTVRIRRSRLMAWITERERAFRREQALLGSDALPPPLMFNKGAA